MRLSKQDREQNKQKVLSTVSCNCLKQYLISNISIYQTKAFKYADKCLMTSFQRKNWYPSNSCNTFIRFCFTWLNINTYHLILEFYSNLFKRQNPDSSNLNKHYVSKSSLYYHCLQKKLLVKLGKCKIIKHKHQLFTMTFMNFSAAKPFLKQGKNGCISWN